MDDTHKNIEEYIPNKKRKILIVLDDVITHMLNNKKRNQIVTESSIRGRKLGISPIFITQSYFAVSKNFRLICTHYVIIQFPNKRDIEQIASSQSSGIVFKDFINHYNKYTVKPYSFLVIDATFAPDNPLRFRKNL